MAPMMKAGLLAVLVAIWVVGVYLIVRVLGAAAGCALPEDVQRATDEQNAVTRGMPPEVPRVQVPRP